MIETGVIILFLALIGFFGYKKFKKAEKGDCCK